MTEHWRWLVALVMGIIAVDRTVFKLNQILQMISLQVSYLKEVVATLGRIESHLHDIKDRLPQTPTDDDL